MIVSILTAASVCINVGYQFPQLLLLRQKSKEKSTPNPSGGEKIDSKSEKSPLSGSSILIKTTGLYFAVAFYYQNGVPFLSWIHQITSIMQDWAMIYYCSTETGEMAVRLVLHVLLCVTLILSTPIAQFGMTIKTILTLIFKINNIFFMIRLKSAKNISAQTYLLSMSGNLLILSLNFYQMNLFPIYLNCIINLSMDVLIIILSRVYVSQKTD